MALLTYGHDQDKILANTKNLPGSSSQHEPLLFSIFVVLAGTADSSSQVFSGVSNSVSPKLEINKRCLKLDGFMKVFRIVTWVGNQWLFLVEYISM